MNKNILAGVIALLVLGFGYYWYSTSTKGRVPQTTTTPPVAETPALAAQAPATTGIGTTIPKIVTVTYAGTGFSPASVTIAKGDTVMFVAGTDDKVMWVASGPHPTHQGYDGTTRDQHCASGYSGSAPFDQCATGASFSFTFAKAGTWKYHNHVNSGQTGTVIVQ